MPIDIPDLAAHAVKDISRFVRNNIIDSENLLQIGAILAFCIVARLLARRIERWYDAWCERRGKSPAHGTVGQVAIKLIVPAVWLIFLWLAVMIARAAHFPNHILTIAMSLLAAWLVIRPAGILFDNPVLAKAIAFTAWAVAALNILNLLDNVLNFLAKISFKVGKTSISVLALFQAALLFAVLIWLASLITGFVERKMAENKILSPSIQVLSAKLIKIVLVMTAVLISLSAVGIDLTAFAVFGGAIGVGIGLGLQKSVANFTSGILLLLDKSIKPGDIISVGDTFGWVKSLNARYVSIETGNGIEHLIPNEDLIVQRVENWSFSNRRVRLKAAVGIHYQSDLRLAMSLCIEAAATTPRVLADPAPICLLVGFGDSAVNLDVRLWIDDPEHGTSNVISEVLLRIWDLFREHGIQMPYPQRDIHIKTPISLAGSAGAERAEEARG